MRMNEKNVKDMFKIIEDGRMVGKLGFDADQFLAWMNTINMINSLPYGKTIIDGYLLSEYEITSKLQDMIQPVKVQVESVNYATNFKSESHYKFVALKTETDVEFDILSPVQFNLISGAINGSRKASHGDTVPVVNRRTDVLLSTNSTKYCSDTDTKVRALDVYYVPTVLTIRLYDQSLYTEERDAMFEKWAYETMTNFRSNSSN